MTERKDRMSEELSDQAFLLVARFFEHHAPPEYPFDENTDVCHFEDSEQAGIEIGKAVINNLKHLAMSVPEAWFYRFMFLRNGRFALFQNRLYLVPWTPRASDALLFGYEQSPIKSALDIVMRLRLDGDQVICNDSVSDHEKFEWRQIQALIGYKLNARRLDPLVNQSPNDSRLWNEFLYRVLKKNLVEGNRPTPKPVGVLRLFRKRNIIKLELKDKGWSLAPTGKDQHYFEEFKQWVLKHSPLSKSLAEALRALKGG